MAKKDYSHWLPDNEYKKLIGQFRLQLNDIFFPLRRYGQDVYVDGAIEEVMQLTEERDKKIRGRDVPLIVKKKINPRT